MGIEETLAENSNIMPKEENLSEKYDKLRQEKMERIYKGDYQNMILTYIMMGMMLKGSY